jgi:hypothetical protein
MAISNAGQVYSTFGEHVNSAEKIASKAEGFGVNSPVSEPPLCTFHFTTSPQKLS